MSCGGWWWVVRASYGWGRCGIVADNKMLPKRDAMARDEPASMHFGSFGTTKARAFGLITLLGIRIVSGLF